MYSMSLDQRFNEDRNPYREGSSNSNRQRYGYNRRTDDRRREYNNWDHSRYYHHDNYHMDYERQSYGSNMRRETLEEQHLHYSFQYRYYENSHHHFFPQENSGSYGRSNSRSNYTDRFFPYRNSEAVSFTDESRSWGRCRTNAPRNHRNRSKKLVVPDNWKDIPKYSSLIHGFFIASKTPLDKKYSSKLKKDDQFSIEDLITMKLPPDVELGMVIDLTNTNKYYDGEEEFRGTGIVYKKLKIEGFNAPPDKEDVDKFFTIVQNFRKENPNSAVLVHCTHGLNRTGYLIAQYLTRISGLSISTALKAFGAARPPGLLKYSYIRDLHQFFNSQEDHIQYPDLPSWGRKYSNS